MTRRTLAELCMGASWERNTTWRGDRAAEAPKPHTPTRTGDSKDSDLDAVGDNQACRARWRVHDSPQPCPQQQVCSAERSSSSGMPTKAQVRAHRTKCSLIRTLWTISSRKQSKYVTLARPGCRLNQARRVFVRAEDDKKGDAPVRLFSDSTCVTHASERTHRRASQGSHPADMPASPRMPAAFRRHPRSRNEEARASRG